MRGAHVGDHPVGSELRRPVGVRRTRRDALRDRHLLGLAVHGAGRGEHEPSDAGTACIGFEQIQGSEHVIAVIALGVLDRLGHECEGGEMEHGLKRISDCTADRIKVAQVAFDELRLRRDGLAMAPFEIVEHDDIVASVNQMTGHDRADVACAASDEQSHRDRSVDDVENPMSWAHITDVESCLPR